ncbi:MAG: hypothetical protein V2A54_09005 [Bacteroidota bacterium]
MIKQISIKLYMALLWIPAHAGPLRRNASAKYFLLGIILAGMISTSCHKRVKSSPTCYKPAPPSTGMKQGVIEKGIEKNNVIYSDEKI